MSARLRLSRIASAALLVAAMSACGISGGDAEQMGTRSSVDTGREKDDIGEDASGEHETDADGVSSSKADGEVAGPDAIGDDEGGVSIFGGKDETQSGSRPSAAEITAAFEEEVGTSLPDGVAECIGEGLHDSDLPNGVLRALVEGREAEVDSGNLEDYENTVETVATECASAAF